MDRWYYRIAINANDIDSLLCTLCDSDFNPNKEKKFDDQNRDDGLDEYLLRIDVEGDQHKNSADSFIEDVYSSKILERTKKISIPFSTKLKRDLFSRIWELLVIFFGTSSTAIPTLITTNENEIKLQIPPDIHWIFVVALVPTVLYYIAGLRKLNEKYGTVKTNY